MGRKDVVNFLLRAGIAFAFIYPAVAAFFDPLSWVGFFPSIVRDTFPGDDIILLQIFGITEVILAFWILIGRNVFVPSVIATVYLTTIVIFNLPLLDIVFRDISILVMALALAVWEKEKQHEHL